MIDEPTVDDRPPGGNRAVYLHIGTLKTGTSFIQSVLLRNVDRLHHDGILFPIDQTRWALQVRAVRDVLDRKGQTPVRGDWDRLVAQITEWPGRASVVSMEFLSLATTAQVETIVGSLQAVDVHVVLTLRDLARVLPSAWQSMIKQGRPWSFEEFVAGVTADDPRSNEPGQRFWLHHDAVTIAERWLAAVGPERLHVVTVPPSSRPPSLLWQRFCEVLALDGDAYDITQDQKSNFSLSYSDTELLRQVNVELATMPKRDHKRWATRFLANRVLRAASSEDIADDRPEVDDATRDWAVRRSELLIEALRALDLHVVGDLEELLPQPPSSDRATAGPKIVYPDRAAYVLASMIRKLVEIESDRSARSTGQVATAPLRRRNRPGGTRRAGGGASDDHDDDEDDFYDQEAIDEDRPRRPGERSR